MPKSKSNRSKGLKAKAKAKAKPKRVSKKGLGLFHSLPYKSELASRAHMYGSNPYFSLFERIGEAVKESLKKH